MYTCCPNCESVFAVSAGILTEAAGMARCGECRHVYNVFDALYDDLPAVRAVLSEARYQRMEEMVDDAGEVDAPELNDAADEEREEDAPVALATPVYAGADWQQAEFGVSGFAHLAGILLLLLLLGGQWMWFNRVALAADPAWKPRVEQFCSLTGCQLPLPAALSQLELVRRDVRRHPSVAGALLVDAEFENRADFTQRYPVFVVRFSSSTGQPDAMRYFRPAEYLDPDADIAAGIPPGGRVSLALELVDPGEEAASYQFDFL